MCLDQLVDQRPYLVEVKFRCRVRIEHRSVIDVFAAFFHQRSHCQFLDIDVRPHQRDQLRWNAVDHGRLDAAGIDEAWQLDRTSVGQLRKVAPVGDIAVDN